ncbi:hypothetical protein NBRC10512_007480 [Rhodotorula toruloides]|uniref:RHTO0S06e00826g1_1 n=2 Tax=Rhodotorula toruloides TaxID=5286 RepID=A0A061B2U5_RHOTO|nr:nucleotide-binding, alpha-beta plait domain containing protein [Rhodotorula toruloides NP11]EMS24029.1 nucleotide-binding, alpha-beta plait domain containing protein [Rhodotorula toruloides NP11]CDR41334.1 RHTO0S06e00826g1_1 [Rhodotorula toruloides]
MRRRGLLDSTSEAAAKGIDLDHSSLHYSALASAVIKPHSELREAILLILLRFVRKVNHTAAFWLAGSGSIEWAAKLLNAWDSQQDLPPLTRLLQILIDIAPLEAEAWIVEHLPPHPAPDSLTGYGPLPRLDIDPPPDAPRASSTSDSSVSVSPDPPSSKHDADRFESPATSLSDACAPSSSPSASLQSSPQASYVTTRAPEQLAARQPTPAAPRQQVQMPHQPVPVELELGNLPLDAIDEEVLRLFQHFRLNPSLVSVRNFSRSKTATLRVASEEEFQAASAALQDAQLRGHKLLVARLSHRPTPRDPVVILRNLPPSSRPQTLHDLVVQAKCGGYHSCIRQQGQTSCTGVFGVPSEEAARLTVSRLNGLLVSGRKIRAEWRRAS